MGAEGKARELVADEVGDAGLVRGSAGVGAGVADEAGGGGGKLDIEAEGSVFGIGAVDAVSGFEVGGGADAEGAEVFGGEAGDGGGGDSDLIGDNFGEGSELEAESGEFVEGAGEEERGKASVEVEGGEDDGLKALCALSRVEPELVGLREGAKQGGPVEALEGGGEGVWEGVDGGAEDVEAGMLDEGDEVLAGGVGVHGVGVANLEEVIVGEIGEDLEEDLVKDGEMLVLDEPGFKAVEGGVVREWVEEGVTGEPAEDDVGIETLFGFAEGQIVEVLDEDDAQELVGGVGNGGAWAAEVVVVGDEFVEGGEIEFGGEFDEQMTAVMQEDGGEEVIVEEGDEGGPEIDDDKRERML